MRILVFGGCILAITALAGTAQLSFLVLNLPSAPKGQLPDGWQVKVNRGTPQIQMVKEGAETSLRLKSSKSSFGLERAVDIDPAQFPYLTWRWKVGQLPAGADFRRASTDDQAAQVLVVFKDRRVLTYIWDSTAPKGAAQPVTSFPLVHIFAVVCRSGATEINQWLAEAHNVAADFEKAYGFAPPHVRGIRLQINSQHTGTSAESQFAEVAFRSTLP